MLDSQPQETLSRKNSQNLATPSSSSPKGTGSSLGRWGFYFLFCGSVSYMLFTLSFLEDRDSSPSWLCVEETFMKMLSHGVDGWARCSLQSLHGLSWVPFFFSPYEDALYKISSKKVSPTIDHCF